MTQKALGQHRHAWRSARPPCVSAASLYSIYALLFALSALLRRLSSVIPRMREMTRTANRNCEAGLHCWKPAGTSSGPDCSPTGRIPDTSHGSRIRRGQWHCVPMKKTSGTSFGPDGSLKAVFPRQKGPVEVPTGPQRAQVIEREADDKRATWRRSEFALICRPRWLLTFASTSRICSLLFVCLACLFIFTFLHLIIF